jgi:DNA-binding NarL/FixJ family response regulator
MYKILIADDHSVVRQGVKQILLDEFQQAEIGEAQNAQRVLEMLAEEKWDAAVLDLTMPGTNGLDLLKQIKHTWPRLPVLILSMHTEDQYAVRALKAGASGYLTKESASAELVTALHRVLGGGKYISPPVADALLTHVKSDDTRPLHELLSDREYQVLLLIASGKEVTQISEALALSVKTVSTYRARVLEKMKMRTNAELTMYAVNNKLVT